MIKFLTEPKNFKEPHNDLGFNIEAIGVQIPMQDLNNLENMSLVFFFFKKVNGEFVEHSRISIPTVSKKIPVSESVVIDLMAGLFSYDKVKVYNAAKIFALRSNYILLPIEEQSDLNTTL